MHSSLESEMLLLFAGWRVSHPRFGEASEGGGNFGLAEGRGPIVVPKEHNSLELTSLSCRKDGEGSIPQRVARRSDR